MTLAATIEAARAALLAEAPRIVETMAQTRLALVTLRVQNNGIGVRYSTSPVPVFFFKNKVLNAGGAAYIKQQQAVKGKGKGLGTWGGLRAAEGLPTGSVNLTYTGRMFRSLTTIYAGFSGAVYTAAVVAADAEEAAKVGYNITRYGDFLAPTATEAAEVAQVGQVAVDKIIQQAFQQAA